MRVPVHDWKWSYTAMSFLKQQCSSAAWCTLPSRLDPILPQLEDAFCARFLLCSMCMSLGDFSGINKFVKAACYEFFAQELVLVLCWLLQCLLIFSNWPSILILILMSVLLATFACFMRLSQTSAEVEWGGMNPAELCPFCWVGKLSDCVGETRSTSPAFLNGFRTPSEEVAGKHILFFLSFETEFWH